MKHFQPFLSSVNNEKPGSEVVRKTVQLQCGMDYDSYTLGKMAGLEDEDWSLFDNLPSTSSQANRQKRRHTADEEQPARKKLSVEEYKKRRRNNPVVENIEQQLLECPTLDEPASKFAPQLLETPQVGLSLYEHHRDRIQNFQKEVKKSGAPIQTGYISAPPQCSIDKPIDEVPQPARTKRTRRGRPGRGARERHSRKWLNRLQANDSL